MMFIDWKTIVKWMVLCKFIYTFKKIPVKIIQLVHLQKLTSWL